MLNTAVDTRPRERAVYSWNSVLQVYIGWPYRVVSWGVKQTCQASQNNCVCKHHSTWHWKRMRGCKPKNLRNRICVFSGIWFLGRPGYYKQWLCIRNVEWIQSYHKRFFSYKCVIYRSFVVKFQIMLHIFITGLGYTITYMHSFFEEIKIIKFSLKICLIYGRYQLLNKLKLLTSRYQCIHETRNS